MRRRVEALTGSIDVQQVTVRETAEGQGDVTADVRLHTKAHGSLRAMLTVLVGKTRGLAILGVSRDGDFARDQAVFRQFTENCGFAADNRFVVPHVSASELGLHEGAGLPFATIGYVSCIGVFIVAFILRSFGVI